MEIHQEIEKEKEDILTTCSEKNSTPEMPLKKDLIPETKKEDFFKDFNSEKEKIIMEFKRELKESMLKELREEIKKEIFPQLIQEIKDQLKIEATLEKIKEEEKKVDKIEKESKTELQKEEEKKIMEKSIEKYELELKEYSLMSMKIEKFCYEGEISKDDNQLKTQRLVSEIKLLSKNLPLNFTNSIFVRYDVENSAIMRAMIAGVSDTPYDSGLFIFDANFGDNYPNSPPQVSIMTNGHQTFRFNPNLYEDGLCCLSILGTWEGDETVDEWDPETSNFLRVLLSIQSLVMSEDVYFNEPGCEALKGTDNGKKLNNAYSNIVRYGNIKYAMLEHIKNPPKGFEDIVKKHFFYKKDYIKKECSKWVENAENEKIEDVSYTSYVLNHNNALAKEFLLEKGYYKALKSIVEELFIELDKISI